LRPLNLPVSPAQSTVPPNEIAIHFVLYTEGAIIMFETAVQEKRTGVFWGIVMGLSAFAVLLGAG